MIKILNLPIEKTAQLLIIKQILNWIIYSTLIIEIHWFTLQELPTQIIVIEFYCALCRWNWVNHKWNEYQ